MPRASVLIAPDKFKGSLTSFEVSAALASGFEDAAGAAVHVDCLPLADGGDGSVAAAVSAGFTPSHLVVPGPTGDPVRATIAERRGTVIIEVANTCGLQLLPGGRLQPLVASSRGVGAALRHVLDGRPERIVLALGGSASTDGGLGMLTELGATTHPRAESTLEALSQVEQLDLTSIPGLGDVDLVLATDVNNPLLGPNGAAAVFGPQKGADPTTVRQLQAGLQRLVDAVSRNRDDGRLLAQAAGGGAAGGIGFAGMLLGGRVVSGADYFLDLLQFDALAEGRDLVLTGEGRFDFQSLAGKLPVAVARRSGGVPVAVVAGRSDVPAVDWAGHGIQAVYDIGSMTTLNTANDPVLTRDLLRRVGRQVGASLARSQPQETASRGIAPH